MNNTKAVHLNSFRKFVLTKANEATLQRIFGLMSPEDQAVLSKPVMHNSWLDYSLWWRLLLTADKVLGKGDLQLIREIGAFDARENLNGIYKTFIAFMRPDFVISNTSMIWKRYYDSGVMKAVSVSRTEAELWLSDWKTLPVNHELEIIGWMEAALAITGVKQVRLTHTTCMARGDDHCTFKIAWD